MAVGLLGTGLMGEPMALRLQACDVAVVAWNRSPDKLAPLKEAGISVAASPAEVIQQTDVTVLMLSDAAALRSVLLAPATESVLAGKTLIQMGTIAPQESRNLAEAIAQHNGHYLEAPVLGSIPQVKSGTLQIMVGSTPAQFEQWSPVLRHWGEPQHIGAVGSAAALKLALNQLIASLTTGFAQSLGLIQQQGVPVETFMAILRDSALYAPTFDKKLDRMQDRNFENPNFPTKHLLKDVRLFLQTAEAAGSRVDSLDGIRQILEDACQQGLSDLDYSALFAAMNPPTHESVS